jgi:hypothetical protein
MGCAGLQLGRGWSVSDPDAPKTPPAPVSPWIEKWLLVGMIALVILFTLMMTIGTSPSRRTERTSTRSATLLCFRVKDQIAHDIKTGQEPDRVTIDSYHDLCDTLLRNYER